MNTKRYRIVLGNLREGTQNHAILKHLLEHGSITTFEAFTKYNITRLPCRIFDLRGLGVDVETEIIVKKREGKTSHYAMYKVR